MIGGGTGELPPKDMNISVLGGCNLFMDFKLLSGLSVT